MADSGPLFGQETPIQKVLAPMFEKPLPAQNPLVRLFESAAFEAALQNVNLTKRRQYFVNQTVNLDGLRFEECRFDDCVLHTETGDVSLKDCVIGQGTKLSLGARLQNVAKLSKIFGQFPPTWHPTVRPLGQNTWTVSIP